MFVPLKIPPSAAGTAMLLDSSPAGQPLRGVGELCLGIHLPQLHPAALQGAPGKPEPVAPSQLTLSSPLV